MSALYAIEVEPPGRRIVLLTVFAKTKSAETAEVERAARAQQPCGKKHQIAHESYERKLT